MKTVWLIVMFPIFLVFVVWLVFLISMMSKGDTLLVQGALNYQLLYNAGIASLDILILLIPIIIVWFIISFLLHRQLVFLFSGAKKLERKDNPEIYNIVENLCISRGLQVPSIGILEDDSLNTFATGRGRKSWIVFSRGIINKLEKKEIESVAAHELTHIINRDTLLMVVIVVFVGIIGTLGEIVMRIGLRMKGEKDSAQFKLGLVLGGIALMIVGYLVFPLIRLAVSRKREFLADAGSVELTKDKDAMISALQKISQDSVIESIEKQTVAAMCIESPFAKKGGFFNNLFSTHPSIEDRIKALQNY